MYKLFIVKTLPQDESLRSSPEYMELPHHRHPFLLRHTFSLPTLTTQSSVATADDLKLRHNLEKDRTSLAKDTSSKVTVQHPQTSQAVNTFCPDSTKQVATLVSYDLNENKLSLLSDRLQMSNIHYTPQNPPMLQVMNIQYASKKRFQFGSVFVRSILQAKEHLGVLPRVTETKLNENERFIERNETKLETFF